MGDELLREPYGSSASLEGAFSQPLSIDVSPLQKLLVNLANQVIRQSQSRPPLRRWSTPRDEYGIFARLGENTRNRAVLTAAGGEAAVRQRRAQRRARQHEGARGGGRIP